MTTLLLSRFRLPVMLATVLALPPLLGCDDKPLGRPAVVPENAGAAADGCAVESLVFTPFCAGCHGEGGIPPVLEVGTAGGLIDIVAADGATPYVVAGAPEDSLLYRKVAGTQGPDEGDRMPLGAPLDESYLELLSTWIREGATSCRAATDEAVDVGVDADADADAGIGPDADADADAGMGPDADADAGTDTGACTPTCGGKQCGDDGCGGSCGDCGSAESCSTIGECVCTPACGGKQCGDDGCGGSCGDCGSAESCSSVGECVCTPACEGKQCGDDGCGGSCGNCPGALLCNSVNGTCAQTCSPTTCAAEGWGCGDLDDGCGGTLSCGTCTAPETCGGSGVPSVCGCTPTTCAELGEACGDLDDGCGGTLSCACDGNATCIDGQCACTPTTCAAEGWGCGDAPDGCGGTLSCGGCTAPETCGGGGVPAVCGCTPTTCAELGDACGNLDDGCGGTLSCTCEGAATCVDGQCLCTPTTCSSAGYGCGAPDDGCGSTLSCGACAAGETCGADFACHAPRFGADVMPIFTSKCVSCHGSTAPKGGLTLTPAATAYGELVGQPAEGSVCSDIGATRVVPSEPTTSLLYLKVTDDPAKCGAKMPTSGALTDAQKATIRAWIAAGALND